MKKYFLHNGTESSGPFSIEELNEKKITKSTPIWFDGLEHWKTAGEIPELTRLFVATPPPFQKKVSAAPSPKKTSTQKDQRILGLSKNNFIILAAILILAIGTTIFNTLQDSRRRELEIINHKTDIENEQYRIQQIQIEEQKKIVAEQEKKEAERLIKERRIFVDKRIKEIQELVDAKNLNIEILENKLNDVSAFKFFRTPEEKKIQIDLIESEIESLKNEIIILKNEFDQLKLELEKQTKSV
jgi:hypothetical protein